MKKNKKTYLLLIVVFAIWGILGFRIVKTINPNSNEVPYTSKIIEFTPPSKVGRDTFGIIANYRDPFLGTLPKRKEPKKQKTMVSPKENKVDVLYTGFIKESSSGAKIFFITIDGEQRMMSMNDSFKEVRLLSGNSEMIKVRVHGKNKSIAILK